MTRPDPLTIASALCVAAHRDQWREGDSPLPYCSHPFDVAHRIRYEGLVEDTELLCAAYLHDVLEATYTEPEEIQRLFGDRVLNLVLEVTRREPTSAEVAGMSREEIYDLRNSILMGEIAEMSPEAQTIKLADRLSNLTAGKSTRRGKRLERYLRQSRQMLELIPKSANKRLWKRLDKLVSKMEDKL